MKTKINKKIIIGASVLLLFLLLIFIYPSISPFDELEMHVADRLKPPNSTYRLGTDDYGRDLLTRICYGAQVSLFIGFSVAVASCLFGTLLGILAACFPKFDAVFSRISDGFMAIPGILLAMAFISILGGSMLNLFLALILIFTPRVARMIRSEAIVIVKKKYIESSQIIGASWIRVIFLHIIPNLLSTVLVQFVLVFSEAILSEASLSFLGLGVVAPYASLGNILEIGRKFYSKAWWIIVFTGIALIISVWSLGMISSGFGEQFNQLLRNKKVKKQNKESAIAKETL